MAVLAFRTNYITINYYWLVVTIGVAVLPPSPMLLLESGALHWWRLQCHKQTFMTLASGAIVAPQLQWKSAIIQIIIGYSFLFWTLKLVHLRLPIRTNLVYNFVICMSVHLRLPTVQNIIFCDVCAFALTHCAMSLLMGRHVLLYCLNCCEAAHW